MLSKIKLNRMVPHFIFQLTYFSIILINITFAQDVVLKTLENSPSDYAYSKTKLSTRVRDLVTFFDNLKDSTSYDPELREKQNVIISLPEAMNKLYFMIHGNSLEIKCNKYINLINKPNIRTYSIINEIVNEDRLFNEIDQDDANVLAKIINSRSFDALTKIQTIIQTLESEKDSKSGKSLFIPIIQQELLHCINYFIYKHQKATSGLIDYVRVYNSKFDTIVIESSSVALEINLKQFDKIIDEIEHYEKEMIENDTLNKNSTTILWLNSFHKLQNALIENNYKIPKLIVQFITEPKRLQRLNSILEIFENVDKLKSEIEQVESNESGLNLRDNIEYGELLLELNEIVESYKELISNEIYIFVHKPARWSVIERMRSNGEVTKFQELDSKVGLEKETTDTNEEDCERSQQEKQDRLDFNKELLEYYNQTSSHELSSDITNNNVQTCPNISTQLSNYLRSFQFNTISNIDHNYDYIKNVIDELYSYSKQCNSQDNNYYFETQSNWAFFSLTKKVISWSESLILKYKQLINEVVVILDQSKKSKQNCSNCSIVLHNNIVQ